VEPEIKKTIFRGFFGNYQHTLDVKNRAFVPSKFKEGLGSGFMLTKGLDTCLFGYHDDEWSKMTDNLGDIPFTDGDGREFVRFFIGNAVECEVDRQGRFGIPQSLRDYAQLAKEIYFVGMIGHFEIWDSSKWKEASSKYDCSADMKAEKMQKYLRRPKTSDAV
jgi:MraZ protein